MKNQKIKTFKCTICKGNFPAYQKAYYQKKAMCQYCYHTKTNNCGRKPGDWYLQILKERNENAK